MTLRAVRVNKLQPLDGQIYAANISLALSEGDSKRILRCDLQVTTADSVQLADGSIDNIDSVLHAANVETPFAPLVEQVKKVIGEKLTS